MILDLEKVKEIENKYQNNPIVLDAFRIMVTTIAQGAVDATAGETLKELGCIKFTAQKQQLNS
jgi:predicted hydrocarbon binding protein